MGGSMRFDQPSDDRTEWWDKEFDTTSECNGTEQCPCDDCWRAGQRELVRRLMDRPKPGMYETVGDVLLMASVILISAGVTILGVVQVVRFIKGV
jgi:hypothetical protein